MLTGIEKMIADAVKDAKDNALPGLIAMWEKRHGGQVPKENLEEVIFPAIACLLEWPIDSKTGNLYESEDGQTKKSQHHDAQPQNASVPLDEYPKAKILVLLIEILENSELSLPLPLNGKSSVYEWAIENNLGDVLENPIVQRSIIEREIQEMYLQGELKAARELAEEMQDEFNLNPQLLFDTLGTQLTSQSHSLYITPHLLDSIISDLLDHQNVNTAMSSLVSPGLYNVSPLKDHPAVKVATEIEHLFMPTQPNNEVIDVAQLTQDYLQTIDDPIRRTRMANGFIDMFNSSHSPMAEAENSVSLEEIYKVLLDNGATIGTDESGPTMLPLAFTVPTKYGWNKVLQHKGYLDAVKKLDPLQQIDLIRHSFLNPHLAPETAITQYKPMSETFKALCEQIDPSRKSTYANPVAHFSPGKFSFMDIPALFDPSFDPSHFSDEKKADDETRTLALATEAKFNDKLAMLATLIECDLIHNLEELESEIGNATMPTLLITNPKDQTNYTIKDFIMAYDITRKAYESKIGVDPAKAEVTKQSNAKNKGKGKSKAPILTLQKARAGKKGSSSVPAASSSSRQKKKNKKS